jgi:hypothetical protein
MVGISVFMLVFRLLHIAIGIAWVGSVFLFVVFLQPTAAAIAPAGAPFMAELLGKRRLSDRIVGMGVATVVAGVDERELEVAVLRHQLRILHRRGKRARYGAADRAFLAAVSRFLPRERWSAFPVVPETLKRWRRQLEARKDPRRRRGPGRPPIDPALRELILRLGRENPRWGYLRIKGELLKLGITVSATTIANVLGRGGQGPAPRRIGPTWGEFLRAQALAFLPTGTCASDFEDRARHESGPAPGPGRRQARTRSSKDAAPMRVRPLRIPLVIGGPLGKSPSSQGYMGGRRSELCTAYRPAVRAFATDRSLLTFVWSPCPSTAGLLGAHPARPTAGWLPLSTLPSSADRPSLAAFRFRGVIRRSIPPPDRIPVPNSPSPGWAPALVGLLLGQDL